MKSTKEYIFEEEFMDKLESGRVDRWVEQGNLVASEQPQLDRPPDNPINLTSDRPG
jgi:hypothetical protein